MNNTGSALSVANCDPGDRLYLPVCADADAGDSLVQQLQTGHRMGRLVDALVQRTVPRRCDDERGGG